MYKIISNNQVVAICDRFRWVRMMDGDLVGTIKATAQGFEARVPVQDGDTYTFEKQVYALFQGGLTFEHGRLAIMAAAKRVGPKE